MEVKSKIISFLKQRRAAAIQGKVDNARVVQANAEQLLNDFDMIKNMNEWRHLREIFNQSAKIKSILPMPYNGHAEIREKILELLELAETHASEPRHMAVTFTDRAAISQRIN